MNRYLKFFLFFAVAAVAIILASPSIQAQIKNIYDASEENVAGITSLMSAVTSDDLNGVKFFSRAGGALVNQKNIGGATALHMACREASFEVIKTLVDNGADINAVDNEGWTPLMRAALAGKKEAVALLLSKGAQASAVNSVGESAILHAVSSDCNECLSLMFEKFNFVQDMHIELLKSQLADAFVVTRNRNNQVAQDMIASYLERIAQIAPVVENKSPAMMPIAPVDNSFKGKKFVLKTDKKPGKTKTKIEKEEVLELPTEPVGEFTQQDLRTFGKFKFITGEPGKSRKGKGKFRMGVVKEEAVVLEKKDEKKVEVVDVDIAVESAVPVGGVVYKFNSGPKGKIIKRKNKPKSVVAPAVVAPVTTAPVANPTSKIVQPAAAPAPTATTTNTTVTAPATPTAPTAVAPAPAASTATPPTPAPATPVAK